MAMVPIRTPKRFFSIAPQLGWVISEEPLPTQTVPFGTAELACLGSAH